jgi:hypothetical protein
MKPGSAVFFFREHRKNVLGHGPEISLVSGLEWDLFGDIRDRWLSVRRDWLRFPSERSGAGAWPV